MRFRRAFLVLAAAWDVGVGTIAVTLPRGRVARSRESGVVVLVFAVLYAVLAVRPSRRLLVVSALAKAVGGTSGVIGLARGRRDVITWLALADAAWLPGFVAASRGASPTPERG
jgi:hypothetical protein